MSHFLKTKKTKIVGKSNKPVYLRGVNLGGWLMMEAYFMHSPNRPEKTFRSNFSKTLGKKALDDFDNGFRSNFIRESDICSIARHGFNCIRVPFHYRLIEKAPYQYDKKGLGILDKVLRWAEKYKIYVILDFHAAPGCQNHDWHSDSSGKAKLWKSKSYQKRTVELWRFLANRYKNKKYLAGYDLLNEAVVKNTKLLNQLYKEIIKAIRSVDSNHILFIEGNLWATDLKCLDLFKDDNYVLSIHNYEPIEFTFNLVPHMSYPNKINGKVYKKQNIINHLSRYVKLAKKHNVPIFVGEFGVNAREGLYGEHLWLKDTLSHFKKYGFHWTYWTYKAVKNSAFPDGIYSYVKNPPWVNRLGPLMGWQTFALHWKKSKNQMMASWRSDQFEVNSLILKTLKNGK